MKQNYRIRQVLQRLTGEIKEFDGVQSSLSELLCVPGFHVPQQVLDAFSHDPAAVTGSTRRLKGWRAVEDIHARISWQREVLQNFVTAVAGLKGKDLPTGIFDESIAGLMESVAQLEQHRDVIVENAEEVTDLLARVREIHGYVKAEFNDTLAHTSQIYPEVCFYPILIHPSSQYDPDLPNIYLRRELSGQIPTLLDFGNGCVNIHPRFCYTFLENVWKDNRSRCPGLSHHTLVSQRIHGRTQAISYYAFTKQIASTLVGPTSIAYSHLWYHDPASTRGDFLVFMDPQVAVPQKFRPVDNIPTASSHRRNNPVGCSSVRTVYNIGRDMRCYLVDWMVCRTLYMII
jgi:hypothetical protein